MKLSTYRATPGLDRYAARERFGAWRAAHRRLMRGDAAYRRRFRIYLVVVISIVGFSTGAGWLAASMLAQAVFPVAGAMCVCGLAFRQQRYMNRRAATVLNSGL